MTKTLMLLVCGAVGYESLALAASPTTQQPAAPQPAKVCKMVVSAKPGTKPFEMCMTQAEWDAKKIAEAKDANRIVCRYESDSKTRFRSFKVCMTAAEWDNARLADRQLLERIQMQTCVQGAGC